MRPFSSARSLRNTVARPFAFSLSNSTPLAIEEGKSDAWVDVAKVGEWNGYVGADGKKRTVKVTHDHFDSAIAEFTRNGNEMVLDYEHQSLSGGEAPASGWIDELRVEGDKLRGHVTFTERAAAAIRAREYKYTSPVWAMNEPDRVTGETLLAQIPCVALTNVPFQGGLTPVSLSRTRMARITEGDPMSPEETHKLLDGAMKLLGVTDPATFLPALEQLIGAPVAEDAPAPMSVPAAMSRLKAKDAAMVAMRSELAAKSAALESATASIAARTAEDEANASKAADALAASKADALISMGKALPGSRDHFVAFARSNPAGFDAMAATLPEIVPMSKRAGKSEARGLTGAIDASNPLVAAFKARGYSDEKIAATLAKHGPQSA